MKTEFENGGEDRKDSLMTACLPLASGHVLASSQTLVDVARCWRAARDQGDPVQPSLFRLLAKRSGDMLAPVFDSLLTLYEAVLGRPVATGEAAMLSDDEACLLGLVEGLRPVHACIDCAEGAASALQCAICSTRIMIDLAAEVPGLPIHT